MIEATFSGRAGDEVRDDTSTDERRELGEAEFVVTDMRVVRGVKKELIPVPQPPRIGLVGSGRFIDMLSGRSPLTSGFVCVLATLSRDLDASTFTATTCSGSAWGLFGLLAPLVLDVLDALEVELGFRCIQRSRTPSTALKKFVDPAVKVREIASRVGASCWSSLRSEIPSDIRSPKSATTEGFSLQGWLSE